MAFTGPNEDRVAIRELYGSYSYASTREQVEEWLACWTEDGQWNSEFFNRSGKDELLEQWKMLWSNFAKVAFFCEIGSIEVDGDRALAGSITREIILLKNGGIYKVAGRYEDTLVRQSGQWLFARRDYQSLVEELPENSGAGASDRSA